LTRALRAGALAAAALGLSGCLLFLPMPSRKSPEQSQANLLPMPAPQPHRPPGRSEDQLTSEVNALGDRIGGYPPHFQSEVERQDAYDRWSDLLLDAQALPWSTAGEATRLGLLGELYRQGFDMDVASAGSLAEATLLQCIDLHPRAINCNWSLVFLYLSVTPSDERLKQVRFSLDVLRQELGPAPNEEVEYYSALLRAFNGDVDGARRQIDAYFKDFPQGPHSDDLHKLSSEIDEAESKRKKEASAP